MRPSLTGSFLLPRYSRCRKRLCTDPTLWTRFWLRDLCTTAKHPFVSLPAQRRSRGSVCTKGEQLLSSEVMKRAASGNAGSPKAKKPREDEEPAYHETPSVRDKYGEIIWPAPTNDMEMARQILKDW